MTAPLQTIESPDGLAGQSLGAAPGSARRRLQINGHPAVMLADEKAVTRHLAPMQPKWKERDARAKRIHLGDWFRNQGQRSRLLFRGGYIIGRVDCLPNDQGHRQLPK